MKRFFSLMAILTMMFTLAACGNNNSLDQETSQIPTQAENNSSEEEITSQPEELPQTDTGTATDSLIVYFSWSGNTESVAKEIQTQTGADIFEITPTESYTNDYNTLLDIAQEEQASDVRPEIAETVENFEQYDVVYLGYPNWWGDMPMILYSFLDEYDFAGKTIAPFVTSGGSGFSGTISSIESLEPDAVVVEGLALDSSESANAGEAVTEWLSAVGTAE